MRAHVIGTVRDRAAGLWCRAAVSGAVVADEADAAAPRVCDVALVKIPRPWSAVKREDWLAARVTILQDTKPAAVGPVNKRLHADYPNRVFS